MTRKQKRLAIIAGAIAFLGGAVGLTLYALGEQTSYFYMPGDIAEQPVSAGQRIRLGGLVAKGSIKRADDTRVSFAVTDGSETVAVSYKGILPDLFREEQGVVTEGAFDDNNVFIADTVLAKHDENYMPREIADSLKEKGVWQDD